MIDRAELRNTLNPRLSRRRPRALTEANALVALGGRQSLERIPAVHEDKSAMTQLAIRLAERAMMPDRIIRAGSA